MATQAVGERFGLDEQFARLHEIVANRGKLTLEGQKLQIERLKLGAERLRMETGRLTVEAGTGKVWPDTKVVPFATIFQGLIAIGALLGAGAAIAEHFFP